MYPECSYQAAVGARGASRVRLGLVALLVATAGLVAASGTAGAQELEWLQPEGGWLVFPTRDDVSYEVNGSVNLTLHSFFDGQRHDLPNFTVTVYRADGEQALEITPVRLSEGLYRLNFTLNASMVYEDYQPMHPQIFSLYFYDRVWKFPLEYDAVRDYYSYEVPEYGSRLYVFPSREPLRPSDTVTLVVRSDHNGQRADPDGVNLTVDGEPLALENWNVGWSRANFTIPGDLAESRGFLVASTVTFDTPEGEVTSERTASFRVEFYHLWSRWVEIGMQSARLEVGIIDFEGRPVGGAPIELSYGYYPEGNGNEVSHTVHAVTNGSGLALLELPYDDRAESTNLEWLVQTKVIPTVNIFSLQSIDLPREIPSEEPRLNLETNDVYYGVYGEPVDLVYPFSLSGYPLAPGAPVRVVIATPYRVLHNGTYYTNAESEIVVNFTPQRCACGDVKETESRIFFAYNNSGNYEGYGWPFNLFNATPYWLPETWSNITLVPANDEQVIWRGRPTRLDLQLPLEFDWDDPASGALGLPSVNLYYTTADDPAQWSPRGTYRSLMLNPFSTSYESYLLIPHFVEAEEVNLTIQLYFDDPQYRLVFQQYVFRTQLADPLPTHWINGKPQDSSDSLTWGGLLMLLPLLVVAVGKRRRRSRD